MLINCHKQKHSCDGQSFANGKSHHDDDGLNTPIGVIDRCVVKNKTEHKGKYGCYDVGNEQIEPPLKRKCVVNQNTNHSCQNINQAYDDETH